MFCPVFLSLIDDLLRAHCGVLRRSWNILLCNVFFFPFSLFFFLSFFLSFLVRKVDLFDPHQFQVLCHNTVHLSFQLAHMENQDQDTQLKEKCRSCMNWFSRASVLPSQVPSLLENLSKVSDFVFVV
jgi:hypothetical protein